MNPAPSSSAAQPPVSAAAKSSGGFIQWFTVRRVRLSALIFAWFAAVESLVQAFGIIKTYPDPATRAKVVHALASNPALGMFYGDRHQDIVSPAGYMVYRILPMLVLIGAVWMVTFVNKMLRGQEETGRWELFLSGQATARMATVRTILGAVLGIVLAYVIVAAAVFGAGQSKQLQFPAGGSLLYGLTVVSGAAVALGIGVVASQLGSTKRKTNLYALLAIAALWVMLAVGNAVDGLAWLRNFTPFGWAEKVHPFAHAQPLWFVPLAALAVLGCVIGVWLAGRRDMGESLVADSASAKPHFGLLRSLWGFDFRANRGMLAGWLAVAVGFAAIIAAADKTVGRTFSADSGDKLARTFGNLSGNASARLELAYLSAGAYVLVTLLMIMVTTGLNAIRDEEASGRLENFVSGTVSRQRWLGIRLVILLLCAGLVTLASNFVLWAVAAGQGVQVHAGSLLGGGMSLIGPVVLLLGLGVLLYGVKPRLAVGFMYLVVAWSFTSDIIASVVHLNHYVADTSLLKHISLVPAAAPNWQAFAAMTLSGLFLAGAGILLFQRRDLALE